eukprot:2373237-Rhodomonas_salina.1
MLLQTINVMRLLTYAMLLQAATISGTDLRYAATICSTVYGTIYSTKYGTGLRYAATDYRLSIAVAAYHWLFALLSLATTSLVFKPLSLLSPTCSRI